jgi:hypothetical protein
MKSGKKYGGEKKIDNGETSFERSKLAKINGKLNYNK